MATAQPHRRDESPPKTPAEVAVHPASADSPVNGSEAEEPRTFAGARRELFSYMKTPRFYWVLLLGQVLSLCITGTNTFSGLLSAHGNSIPAFQTFFNYVLLNIVYTSWTLYKYGLRGWLRMVQRAWWRYLLLAFLDVEGNYFVVLAYRYTTVISAQLINFWAIVVVVVLSAAFLGVRYHWTQLAGILVACGGMGILLASDATHGSALGGMPSQLKGDLFMLLGATLYGFSNVAEEFLVSKAPLYEVIGQLAFWGMLINGAQAGIFDRSSFHSALWSPAIAGYLVGYTLILASFYTLAPIMFRMGSAAFFNISLLTANFYGVAIGIKVFGYTLEKLYPVAFVCIILGCVVYFAYLGVYGEQRKPWLGERQQDGVVGVGTARKRDLEDGVVPGAVGPGMQQQQEEEEEEGEGEAARKTHAEARREEFGAEVGTAQ